MKIRNKLTYLFVGIVAGILLLSSVATYYFSADYREEEFYNRLKNKGQNVAKLLIEVEEVDATLLQKMEANNPLSLHEEAILIYDFEDEVIYRAGQDSSLNVDLELLNTVRLDGEVRFKVNGREAVGFMFLDTYDRFVVFAAAKDVNGLRKISNLRMILFIVFIAGIVISTFLGWFYAGRALRPISKVISEVEQISVANLNHRIDQGNSRDEIAQLAATFNKMLERLEKAFTMQKNFIANASHELRTPLTAITGQLEVTLMNERRAEDYKKTILSVFEDIKSLNTTSNRLLLLAQATAEFSKKDIVPVRIDEVVWLARTEVLKRNQRYSISIEPDSSIDDPQKLVVKGNDQLLKTAIVNLLDNACKYSENHTARLVILFQDGQIRIRVIDTGIGIPEEDLVHIFEPFHRASNAIGYKGHGIGLSLVKRIAELHDGTVRVVSSIAKGTTFTLQFPVSKD